MVTVKLGEARGPSGGWCWLEAAPGGRAPIPSLCMLPGMARGRSPSEPPSLSQFIPGQGPSTLEPLAVMGQRSLGSLSL